MLSHREKTRLWGPYRSPFLWQFNFLILNLNLQLPRSLLVWGSDMEFISIWIVPFKLLSIKIKKTHFTSNYLSSSVIRNRVHTILSCYQCCNCHCTLNIQYFMVIMILYRLDKHKSSMKFSFAVVWMMTSLVTWHLDAVISNSWSSSSYQSAESASLLINIIRWDTIWNGIWTKLRKIF